MKITDTELINYLDSFGRTCMDPQPGIFTQRRVKIWPGLKELWTPRLSLREALKKRVTIIKESKKREKK